MQRLVVINVAGLSWELGTSAAAPTISSLADARPLRPAFPAVTCSMQATLTTGTQPSLHGIVANGLFDRDFLQVRFWEQSDRLVQAPRFWTQAKRLNPEFTSALLFWQNSVGSDADIVMTPAPVHKHDGGMISSCYTRPAGLYDAVAGKLGAFNLMSYWGPMASFESSRWIASAAREVYEQFKPNLLMVYLPHLDYPLQKLGPDDPQIAVEMKKVDGLVAEIKDWAEADGARLAVMSEYGISAVNGVINPNLLLRDAGLLEVRTVEGMELLDIAASKAFAMVDHQIAHIYARPEAVKAAKQVLAADDRVEMVLDEAGKAMYGIDHPRAGELVAVARPDSWFAYHWWHDVENAPDFARTVDIHRKPGYDPCELFLDPVARAITMNTSLVRGSHGHPAGEGVPNAFFACPGCPAGASEAIEADTVADVLLNCILS